MKMGCSVLLINFRGSLGYGEANVQSLPGQIGTNDIRDCIVAIDHFIKEGNLKFGN